MIRKMGLNLLCATLLFAPNAFSSTSMSGVTIDKELTAGAFIDLPIPMKIIADCKIKSEVPLNTIYIKMLNKTGSVDDFPLSTNESKEFIVQNGANLKIFAVAGAKVQIKNTGQSPFTASCTVQFG